MKRIVLAALVILGIGFVAIQLVPYGRDHDNPPVTAEPAWNAAVTRELAVRACFDCHSNETVWPWYTNIAPISWRIQQHVDEGREQLNLSQWGTGEQEADDVGEVIRDGEMPPWDYLLAHPEARLSDAEQRTLIDGLTQSLGVEGGDPGEADEEEDDREGDGGDD